MQIIEEEAIENFNVLYLTQNNSDTDRSYFSQLEAKAGNAFYLHVPQKRPDFLNHLIAIRQLRHYWNPTNYARIYLASVDSPVFRYVIKKNPQASLFSFDDGTANITPGSLYYNLEKYRKANFYSRLLGLPTGQQVKARLRQHYSIYPGFDNFIEQKKISYISLFERVSPSARSENVRHATFFIGQPFHEYLSARHVTALRNWISTQSIDFYVMHPREKCPLLENIPLLDKAGLLAEDAIFRAAADRRPRIISAYSTVLFNISHHNAEKVYLSLGDDDIERKRLALISRTGSMVVDIA